MTDSLAPRRGAVPIPASARGRAAARRERGRSAMQRILRHVAPLALAALLPGALAGAQSAAHAPLPAAVAARAADVLRPGDVVRVRIWREPDLSGDFMVDEGGVVTLPRVGPVAAGEQPIDSVKARVLRAYAAYIDQPSIEVTPLRRVQVTGAVRTPGLYTVDPTMGVADAIALAGGVTPQGQRDRVVVLRDGAQIDARLLPRAVEGRSPLRSGDELYVPERSWMSRNPGIVIGALSAVASLVWAMKR